MNTYVILKTLHIISASILFGTGIGTAFFMLRAYLSGNAEALIVTTKNVVLADWLFTSPAIVVQLITGMWLASMLNISFGSLWFLLVISLFVFVGICWLPVVFIQIRMQSIMKQGGQFDDIRSLMKIWMALGIPAFISMVAIYLLMVSKYGATTLVLS